VAVSIGDILATFKFDTSGIEKGAKDVEKSLTSMGTAAVVKGTLIADAVKGVIKQFAQMAFDATLGAGQYADALENMAASTGISTDSLQGYNVILAQVGLTTQDMAFGLKTLSQKMQEARTGTGDAADTFRQLGIDIRGIKTADQALLAIADASTKLENGMEKSAAMTTLLGRAGQRLIPAFEGGAAAILAARKEAVELGALTPLQIQKLGEMDNAVDKLGVAWQGLMNQLGFLFSGLLTMATKAGTAMVKWAIDVVRGIQNIFGMNEEEMAAPSKRAVVNAKVNGQLMMEHAQKMLDLMLKGQQQHEQQTLTVSAATDERLIAMTEQMVAKGLETEQGAASYLAALANETANRKVASARKELEAYQQYATDRLAGEFKTQEERIQFEKTATLAITQLEAQVVVATTNTATARIQGDTKVLQSTLKTEQTRRTAILASLQADIEYQTAVEGIEREGFENWNLLNKMKLEALKAELNNELAAQGLTAEQTAAIWDKYWAKKKQQQLAFGQQVQEEAMKELQTEARIANAQVAYNDAVYQSEFILFRDVEQMRQMKIAAIEAEQTVLLANQKLSARDRLAIETETLAKIKGVYTQYPTFFQSQLNLIQQSASFTYGAIVNQFSSTMAGMIQGTATFADFQKAMFSTVLQAGITMLVQLAANFVAAQFTMVAAQTTADTAKVVSNVSSNAAIVASNTTAATASVGIWGAATAMIGGFFAAVGAGFMAVMGALVAGVVAVGTFIMGVLSAVAAALSATVFGIPFAGAILVGIGLIAAALAVAGALPEFAEGGIVTGPTVGLLGEAGPEAIIPLSQMGMVANAMGGGESGGGRGQQTIIIMLDGKEIGRKSAEQLMDQVYVRTKLR
jgi:hypothetical protein